MQCGQESCVGEGPDCCSSKRRVPFSAPWEQLHCNVQAVRNLQSTVPVRFFFPAPLTPPSSDGNRAMWIVLKKLTSLHFLLFLAFTDAHCICGSLRGHTVPAQTDIQLGRWWGAKNALKWGCRRHPHDPRASLGFPTPALGHALRKAYLNFQSPFLAAGECPYHGFLHRT